MSWRQHQCLCFHYWDFLTNFWCNNWRSIFDVVERLCYWLDFLTKKHHFFPLNAQVCVFMPNLHVKSWRVSNLFLRAQKRLPLALEFWFGRRSPEWTLCGWAWLVLSSFRRPSYGCRSWNCPPRKSEHYCQLDYWFSNLGGITFFLFYWSMVFCYQNCFDLLWEKIVLVIKKNIWNSRLKAENLQKILDHQNNLLKQWKDRTIFGNRMFQEVSQI